MTELKANSNRMAKNSLFLTIRMVIVLLVSLYTSRVVLNVLGVSDFGVYNVVGGFVSMFAFLNTSLSNGIQRFYNFELGANGDCAVTNVYNAAVLIQISLAILIVILIEPIGYWYITHKMVLPAERLDTAMCLFQFSVLSLVILILQIPYSAVIMSYERMDFFALVGIVDVILRLAIVVILPFLNIDKLFIYGFLVLLVQLVNFVLYFTYGKAKFSNLKLHFNAVDKSLLKNMLSFSGWNVFGSFGNVMREQGLNMILNLFFGPVVNAARGIAYQVSSAVQGFVQNISVSMRPQLTQSYAQGNRARAFKLMYSMSKMGFVVLYMLSLPIMIEIDYILNLWLGDVVPENTAIFVVIVFLISYVNTFNSAVSAIIHSSGNMKTYQLVGMFFSLLTLPIAYIFLKIGFGAQSAFWVLLMTTMLGQYASLFILKLQETFSIRDYNRKVLIPLLLVVSSTIWMPFIPHVLMKTGLLRVIFVCITAIAGIACSFFFLGADSDEKNVLRNLFLKFKVFR